MTKMISIKDFAFSRRSLLQGAGALVVSAAAPAVGTRKAGAAVSAFGSAVKPKLVPDQLDSFIAITADGRVTAFFGKMDMGQGVDVAISQIVAEELDVKYERVTTQLGDTATSVNQGGASGSTAVQRGGKAMRAIAAEARRVLVEEAAKRLGADANSLVVDDGVVSVKGSPAKKVSYAEILQGKYFNHKLKWNKKYGNSLYSSGVAKPKKTSEYKVVGQSFPRTDIPGKVFGTADMITDVKVPGMVHGRVIHPEKAGTVAKGFDAASIKHIKGARVVHEKNFIGVVADSEWDAIRAAQELKVQWSDGGKPFGEQKDLYNHIRKAKVIAEKMDTSEGDVDAAIKGAAKAIKAEFEWPFQSHASMGPGCAIVDGNPKNPVVWTGSQKPHYTAEGVARMLGMDKDAVRGVWVPGPGCYGRNDAGDAAMQAALLSKAVGKPVRVQGMRHEGIAWDPKGPASIHMARGGVDSRGNVIAYEFISKGFDRQDVRSNESVPGDTLAGQQTGAKLRPRKFWRSPEDTYVFPARKLGWQVIPPFIERYSPLRTSHLRDPLGPQIQFACEQFLDELAEAAGMDPVAFRLKYLKDSRDRDLVKAVAEKAGWKERVGPQKGQGGKTTVSGRGVSYALRNGTRVAVVADVEVDKPSGRVWVRKFTVAHDCGLIINPDALKLCIEGNLVMATSRSIVEEVAFEPDRVTSVDWATYPILETPDAPEAIDIVLINRPDEEATGAGEGATRPISAAIANAIYDATGRRVRRGPMSPEHVKAALA
ncbi:MAG: molybdopterin-dependent oxidoreductase [Alphaproteobacteria bacterium]|nr:molybdopterin-dependent oxidoreductase [Alphaproteobacteria bacterium]